MDKTYIDEVAVLLKKADELCDDARASIETGKPKIDLDYVRIRTLDALQAYIEHARHETARLLAS